MFSKLKKKRDEKKINKIVSKIKKIKIQGARNIAKAALKAYFLSPNERTKKKLIKARPTEPMLVNTLEKADKLGKKKILEHFDKSQEKINKEVFKIIKKADVVFTHCHSSNVINALIYCKEKGKKFEVYNTETRPLFQGRKTSKELRKKKIKVTQFVDSALGIALSKEQGTKKADVVFLGADAILASGVINKVGSEVISNIARDNKIPVYIVADSWKYTDKVKLEERNFQEIWKNRGKIKIRNPAFEKIDKKYISYVISELGKLKLDEFIKKVKKNK